MEYEGESNCPKGIYFHSDVGVLKRLIKGDFIANRIFFFSVRDHYCSTLSQRMLGNIRAGM